MHQGPIAGRRDDFQNAPMVQFAKPSERTGHRSGRRKERAVGTLRAKRREAHDSKRQQLVALQRQQQLTHLSRVAMLGGLSGAIAHEINQPLTAILSNANAAQRFIDQGNIDIAELRETLADIAAEGQRAAEIIRRLRTLMRPGQHPRQRLTLNEVVQETVDLLGGELESRQVALEVALAPALPAVEADRVQLQQVLINLVLNAADAMQELPAPQRRLRVRTSAHPGGSVRMSVIDQGTGIAPHLLSKVFESFFTTKSSGMGLGLAVCQSIVRAHDGSLWAENNPDRGATFHVVLPGYPPKTS